MQLNKNSTVVSRLFTARRFQKERARRAAISFLPHSFPFDTFIIYIIIKIKIHHVIAQQ